MRAKWLPPVLALGVTLLFLVLSLTFLDRFPVATQDEPWIVAPGLKLALRGVYGSDLFAGYFGAAQHDYQAMPAYPLAVAAAFKLLGVGLIQMRLVSVLLGALTVAVTYAVGRYLVGAAAAAMATALLVFWRVAAYGPIFGAGVPLLDLSRVGRYDIAVPPLVLLATGLVVYGMERGKDWWLAVAGGLVGLATLCQLYGAFWLPVMLLVVLWHDGLPHSAEALSRTTSGDTNTALRRSRPTAHKSRLVALRPHRLYFILAGFGVAIAPWLVYIALHWSDYVGQMSFYRPHFGFLRPGFYLANLTNEQQRYPLTPLTGSALPGVAILIVGVPAALIALLRRAWRTRDTGLAAIGLGVLVPMALFALADSEKMLGHVLAVFPFATLALGWACQQIWAGMVRQAAATRLLRVVLATILGVTVWGGVLGILHQRAIAAATTPYSQFEARIGRLLPPCALVLGSPQFQLGLRSHPFRSLLLPFFLSDPSTNPSPVNFEAALERTAPDAILIESPVERYLDAIAPAGSLEHDVYVGFHDYRRRYHGRLVGMVTAANVFYSPIRVYAVDRPSASCRGQASSGVTVSRFAGGKHASLRPGSYAKARADRGDGQPQRTQAGGGAHRCPPGGCSPLYLPSYSPDVNPIELAFSKIKEYLRRVGVRTQDALETAIAAAIDVVTPGDAAGYFRHCGFTSPGQ